MGWQVATFALPCLNGMPLDHLDNLIYLCRCWVRQITPKSKGEKIQNLNLSCRIKIRFKSSRIIKGFRAPVFFQRGKRTKESSLLKYSQECSILFLEAYIFLNLPFKCSLIFSISQIE